MNFTIRYLLYSKLYTPNPPPVKFDICQYLFFNILQIMRLLWHHFISNIANVVIFAGGKFRENVGRTFHVGEIFTILLLFPS